MRDKYNYNSIGCWHIRREIIKGTGGGGGLAVGGVASARTKRSCVLSQTHLGPSPGVLGFFDKGHWIGGHSYRDKYRGKVTVHI
jgi:hypothetical protein